MDNYKIMQYASELANSLIDDNSITQDEYYDLCSMIDTDICAATAFIEQVLMYINGIEY